LRSYVFPESVWAKVKKITVSGDIEFDKIFKVLNIRRKSLNLVVAQAQTAETMKTKEVLKETFHIGKVIKIDV